MKRVAVIMAGGAGERFWPLSRLHYPKQLLKITGSRSMLSAAVERVLPLIGPEDIYVITGQALRDAIQAELPMLPPGNVVAEPEARNTAAALALASAFLESRYPGEDVVTVVLTADHYIRDRDTFCADVRTAIEFAEAHPALVTFGMVPDRPETGYGYIELGEPVSKVSGFGNAVTAPLTDEDERAALTAGRGDSAAEPARSSEGTAGQDKIFRVASFREKPSPDVAAEFLETGRFLWNSGMFVWRNSVLRRALRDHLPAMEARMDAMRQAFSAGDEKALAEAFAPVDKISIDYGVLERAHNVAVVRAVFDWDDIGTWASLQRLLERDGNGNVVFGNGAAVKCEDSIIYSVGDDRRVVVGYGLKDIVVVSTPDAVLVLPADKVQGVKEVVAHLRARGLTSYL